MQMHRSFYVTIDMKHLIICCCFAGLLLSVNKSFFHFPVLEILHQTMGKLLFLSNLISLFIGILLNNMATCMQYLSIASNI